MYIILDVIITNILDEVNILGFDPCTESIASQSIGVGIYYERLGVNNICIMFFTAVLFHSRLVFFIVSRVSFFHLTLFIL